MTVNSSQVYSDKMQFQKENLLLPRENILLCMHLALTMLATNMPGSNRIKCIILYTPLYDDMWMEYEG